MAAAPNWSNSLLKKEEEYMRLNAELESKTAHLVKEAESILKQNDSLLVTSSHHKKGSLLDNVNSEEFIRDSDDEEAGGLSASRQGGSAKASAKKSARSQSSSAKRQRGGSAKAKKPAAGDGDDAETGAAARAFVTEFQRDLAGRVAEMEEEVQPDEEPAADVLPMAAQEMSPEAQLRFLKAKVRVSEEEVARLQAEIHKLQEENRKLTARTKDAEEERNKATRSAQTLQSQLEKYRRSSEEANSKAEGVEKQLAAVRREADQLKRQERQQSAGAQAAEVRLNRALEEVERYKSELAKTRAAKKDLGDGEKKRADTLLQENKKLERQKNDLIAGFRKQMKLIDILKRQRMHLEAAKMLQFSEEEFVKALDWEKGS